MTNKVKGFQRRLHGDYEDDLNLPQPYQYLYSNPIQPMVPLDVAQDGVFILGAYPSAGFATSDGERDVPVGDNWGPFSTERYLDGSRGRCVEFAPTSTTRCGVDSATVAAPRSDTTAVIALLYGIAFAARFVSSAADCLPLPSRRKVDRNGQ